MDVTDDGNGRGYVYNIALFHEQLFCFGAYCLDKWFGEKLFSI